MRNIIVCVKIVPKSDDVTFDNETKTLNRAGADSIINDADKNAIEHAIRLRDRYGGNVVLLSMGPPMFDSYLKLGIAMGADQAILLSDRAFAGSDTLATAFALAGAIRKIGDYDIVLLGEESSDGGTGQVPSQIAELLEVPQILFASDLDVVENFVTAKRSIKGGYEIVKAASPLVISVETGSNQPRFPDFNVKKELDRDYKVPVWTLADIGIEAAETGINGSYTIVSGLIESKGPERKKEFVKGSAEDKLTKILKLIQQS